MTSRPRLNLGTNLVPGLVAVALFVVFVATFLAASFPAPQGFPGGGSVTASIGYALFDISRGSVPSESFLPAFEIIDVALVAALVGAVMLAKTQANGRIAGALRFATDDADDSTARTDGGREDRP